MQKLVFSLVVLYCLSSAGSVGAHNKVVVIPLDGSDFTANGKACPQGELVTGFTANGGLVCSAIGSISPPRILGLSSTVFSGRVIFGGQNGWAGAGAACRSSYSSEPSARMCTQTDIDRVLQLNNTPANVISDIHNVGTWALFHGTGGAFSDVNTDPNNCHNLSYNSGATATGAELRMLFDHTVNGGIAADKALYTIGTTCSNQLRLLCCAGN